MLNEKHRDRMVNIASNNSNKWIPMRIPPVLCWGWIDGFNIPKVMHLSFSHILKVDCMVFDTFLTTTTKTITQIYKCINYCWLVHRCPHTANNTLPNHVLLLIQPFLWLSPIQYPQHFNKLLFNITCMHETTDIRSVFQQRLISQILMYVYWLRSLVKMTAY